MRSAALLFIALLMVHGPALAQDTPSTPEELMQYLRQQRLELRQTQENLRRTQDQHRGEARNTINRVGNDRIDFYEDLDDELDIYPYHGDVAEIFDDRMSEVTREAQRVVTRATTENTDAAVQAIEKADQALFVVANALQQMSFPQPEPQQSSGQLPAPAAAPPPPPQPQPASVPVQQPTQRQMEGVPAPVVSNPQLISRFSPAPQSVRATTTNVSEIANPARVEEQPDILSLPDGPVASVQRAPSPLISRAGHVPAVAQATPAQPLQSDLVGRAVRARTGETVGRIVDVVPATDTGQGDRVVIETGGFLALRDRLIAVPLNTLQSQPQGPVTANLGIAEIERMPGFSYNGTARAANP